jgi:hypothetical protein
VVESDKVTWDLLKNEFIMTMENNNKEDKIKFWDVCARKQKADEKSSHFIRSMKYQAEKCMPGIADGKIADLIRD